MKKGLQAKLDHFGAMCRQKGYRLTHQRLEIFRELAKDSRHPSAEDIYRRIIKRFPTLSPDTVYRTISTLEKIGVIKRVHVLDDRGRFDANTNVHHHLVCKRCKRVEDFYWPTFDQLNIPEQLRAWGQLDSKHVELRGLCRRCMGENS
ncbi:MAG TPA: transcriptional repressor [bacterium]|jgi:Fur family peroxide stress response transcriptional regulator